MVKNGMYWNRRWLLLLLRERYWDNSILPHLEPALPKITITTARAVLRHRLTPYWAPPVCDYYYYCESGIETNSVYLWFAICRITITTARAVLRPHSIHWAFVIPKITITTARAVLRLLPFKSCLCFMAWLLLLLRERYWDVNVDCLRETLRWLLLLLRERYWDSSSKSLMRWSDKITITTARAVLRLFTFFCQECRIRLLLLLRERYWDKLFFRFHN